MTMERYKVFYVAFKFVGLKYLGYGIAFVNQLFFISIAGVETYGIYSFFIFLLSIVAYSNGGVHFAYVVLAASKVGRQLFQCDVFRSAMSINAIALSLLALVTTATYFAGGFDLDFFAKYHFTTYMLLVFSAYSLKSCSLLLMSRERVRNNWSKINVYYIAPPIIEAAAILISTPENIVSNVLIGLNITHLALIFYLSPLRRALRGGVESARTTVRLAPRRNILLYTFRRGMEQNFYNLSFYGILFMVRGLASVSLPVAEFGKFSFALNLSTALILFVGSAKFLVQTHIFAMIATMTNEDAFVEALKLRHIFHLFAASFYFLSSLILYGIGIWSELINGIMPTLLVALVAQLFYENSHGPNMILIQRNKERGLTFIGVAVSVAIWPIHQFLMAEVRGSALTFYGILVAAYVVYSLAANLLAQWQLLKRINFLLLFEPETLILGPSVIVLIYIVGDPLIALLVGCLIIIGAITLQRRELCMVVKSMLSKSE